MLMTTVTMPTMTAVVVVLMVVIMKRRRRRRRRTTPMLVTMTMMATRPQPCSVEHTEPREVATPQLLPATGVKRGAHNRSDRNIH